jgi:quercetin dioxygenase-like cupin family protein
VLVGLTPGQELGDHQVKEHAWVIVVDGTVTFRAGDEEVEAPAGTLARFEPDERHSVRTDRGARILLLLAPWPGPGHYRGSEQQTAPA